MRPILFCNTNQAYRYVIRLVTKCLWCNIRSVLLLYSVYYKKLVGRGDVQSFFSQYYKTKNHLLRCGIFYASYTSFPLLPAKICRKRSKISLITRGKVRLFLLGDENKFWFEETRLPFAVNLHSCNSVVYVSDSSVHIVPERPHCSIKADLLFTNSLRNSI